MSVAAAIALAVSLSLAGELGFDGRGNEYSEGAERGGDQAAQEFCEHGIQTRAVPCRKDGLARNPADEARTVQIR